MSQSQTPLRGRPKKLDRNLILQSALMEYWTKGPSNVSINDICKLTGASKPGVYREFSSDDGLKKSALETYQALAVQPLLDILHSDKPVLEIIDAVIDFITQDRKSMDIPNGCLLVMMTAQSDQLGSSTLEELNRIRANLSAAYFSWVELPNWSDWDVIMTNKHPLGIFIDLRSCVMKLIAASIVSGTGLSE